MYEKQKLRRKLLARRRQLSREEVKSSSEKITNSCIGLLSWADIKYVHIYLPIEKSNEINTWPLINYIWKNYPQIKIYAPKTNGYARLKDDTQLKTGQLGNREPDGKDVEVKNFDIIITPTLAFDRDGFRLGYGRGYYDRFLARQGYSKSIGLAYSFCEVKPQLPRESHDKLLSHIVTENEIIQCH